MILSGIPPAAQRQELRDQPWSGRVWRSKLRRPEPPVNSLLRPRLVAQIDDEPALLTLIVAPAGFGKSTVAAHWAAQPRAAWLAADPEDASLARFWAHLRDAIGEIAPGFGELVNASFALPHRAPAVDLGRMLADELLDAAVPVRLVIEDFHLIPVGETHAFLGGLLEIAPPGLRIVLTSRSEPQLPLRRLRLRGMLNEFHGADLLFTEDEARALFAQAIPALDAARAETLAARLWRQTRGWAAGMHLGVISIDHDDAASTDLAAAEASALLMSLLEETLATRSPAVRTALMRAAVPEAFVADLVASLLPGDEAGAVATEALEFALAADLCRPSSRFGGNWLELHPLFRDGLLRHLVRAESAQAVALVHQRAAAWLTASGMDDAAIAHHLAAGDAAGAAAIIERQVQPTLAREDWPGMARWMALLPRDLVESRPQLLLAQAWVLHFRGLGRQLADVLERLASRLDAGDIPPEDAVAMRAEAMLMQYVSLVPFQIDAAGALATLHQLASQLTPSQVFARGIAHIGIGIGLHTTGRSHDAVVYLEKLVARAPAPFDAVTARLMLGLLFIHGQASHVTEVAAVAEAMHDLSARAGLRLSAGWARRFLGDASYEADDLEQAIEHYTAIVHDHEFLHLAGVREALFGLALSYVAQGRTDDAWRALRRAREIMVGADALEHLALLDAYAAYLALRAGEPDRALAWARSHVPELDSAPLFVGLHPVLIRATILIVTGSEAEMAEAMRALHESRQCAARGHYGAALARVNALLGVAFMKQGHTRLAVEAMSASLAGGPARGFTRLYLDLLPLFGPQMQALAAHGIFPPALQTAVMAERADDEPAPPAGAVGLLTEREQEVLAALSQRLSYKEIADRLFISPLTVKRHASSVYSKLGVTGRNEAIRVVSEPGPQP